MGTETIKTELVVKHMPTGSVGDVEKIKEAIIYQQHASSGPRQQLAAGLAPQMPAERSLLNEIAKIMGVRTTSRMRASGQRQQGHPLLDAEGNQLIGDDGRPLYEMFTPTVEATVRSGPNVHLSDAALRARKHRMMRKLYGSVATPSQEELVRAMGMALDPLATEDEMIESQDIQERYIHGKSATDKQQQQRRRRNLAARREELMLESGLLSRDPITGQRAMPEKLSEADQESLMATLRDPNADDGRKLYARSRLAQESQRRSMAGVQYRAESRYDEKALKDIAQIEKDVEATRKRLDTGKMRERLDAANAKLDRPGFAAMLRDVLSRKPMDFNVPLEGPVPQPRRPLTPAQAREQRFLDQNKEFDEKIAAYRKMSRDERVAPEGREALAAIREDKAKIKESAAEEEKARAEEEARVRAQNNARASRAKILADPRARSVVTDTGRNLFNEDKSIATTGLLGGLNKAAGMAQTAGLGAMALGGSPMLLVGATVARAVTETLTAGLERGTELQKSAEQIYTQAEPVFAREEQVRAARGLTSVKQFSREAQKRADAASRKLGDRDLETAGSGTPEDIDVYSNVATSRFKALQRNLGSVMGLSDASRAYQQFRRQAGVTDMSHDDASLAMKTAFLAGTPQELLARATQLGAIQGNRGGGPRTGLDQRLDIGTLRYQQETLERAGLMGAPMEAILGQTLSRQEAMAALGMRTDFDRDAKFQRVLGEQKIAPQQFGGITGTVNDIRTGLLQQLQAPGKEVLSGLMMAQAFKEGQTYTGAMDYLAKTSDPEQLEKVLKDMGQQSGLNEFIGATLAPADQPAMLRAMQAIREGMTSGPASATGSGTVDDAAMGRGRFEFLSTYSAIGAQRDMADKAKIAQFQSALDSAARGMRATADNLQTLVANVVTLWQLGD